MIPTLTVHDVLLVDQMAYRFGRPHSGDVAVFMPPVPSGGNAFVKRVIAVPGDTLAIEDGIVYRNGNALTEPYENQQPKYDLEIKNYEIYVDGQPLDPKTADVPPRRDWQASNRIPAGYYFMLGDNRNYSDDSHVWGFAQAEKITGRAFLIFWPFDRMRVLR